MVRNMSKSPKDGAAEEDDKQSERMRRVACVSCMIGLM